MTETVKPHPLDTLPHFSFRSRREWLVRFKDKGTTFDERVGLLHGGFDVREYRPSGGEPADLSWEWLVCFYLEVANGYDRWEVEQTKRPDTEDERKEVLKLKAWDVLCMKVFVPENGKEYVQWRVGLHDAHLLDTLIWFFTTKPKRNLKLCANIPFGGRHNNDERARRFLIDFVKYVWQDGGARHDGDRSKDLPDGVEERFRKARPKLLLVLQELGELRLVLKRPMHVPERRALRQMALEHVPPAMRHELSVEDALFSNNEAEAEVLLLLKARRGVLARIKRGLLPQKRQERRAATERKRQLIIGERERLEQELEKLPKVT